MKRGNLPSLPNRDVAKARIASEEFVPDGQSLPAETPKKKQPQKQTGASKPKQAPQKPTASQKSKAKSSGSENQQHVQNPPYPSKAAKRRAAKERKAKRLQKAARERTAHQKARARGNRRRKPKEQIGIVIAGGRYFDDYDLMVREVNKIIGKPSPSHTTIISGAAEGADKLGERYAKSRGFGVRRFPADWDNHTEGRCPDWHFELPTCKMAGILRNEKMAKAADLVIVFWDGRSRGSLHMLSYAKKIGTPTVVVRYRPGVVSYQPC